MNNHMTAVNCSPLLAASIVSAVTLFSSRLTQAAPYFDAVAAGDMSSQGAIIWTRADNGGAAKGLIGQVSTDAAFSNIVWSGSGSTVPANDYTLKLAATGLASNGHYYYRFTDGSTASQIGQFSTTPAPDQAAPFKIGFTGDADGALPALYLHGGVRDPGQRWVARSQRLHLLRRHNIRNCEHRLALGADPRAGKLGGGGAGGIAGVQSKVSRKHHCVTAAGTTTTTGQQGLQSFLGAVGTYTLLDNHELGNKTLQSGGAPPPAASPNPNPAFDVNTTGTYNNKTVAFQTTEENPSSTIIQPPPDIQGTPTGGLTISNLLQTSPAVNAPRGCAV